MPRDLLRGTLAHLVAILDGDHEPRHLGRVDEVRRGDIVLLRTDWTDKMYGRWPDYFTQSPYFPPESAEWLVARGAKNIGFDFFEEYCGARLTLNCMRIGGLPFDLPAGWTERLSEFLDDLPARIDDYEQLLTDNRIWKNRTVGIGVISAQECVEWGLTGPILRGSGVEWDLRRAQPYECYDELDFVVPTRSNGDTYDRYIVPTPGKIYWDGLISAAGKIRWDNPNRAPLLLIGGGIDLIAEAKMTKAMFEKQKHAASNTELKIFPKRSHWTCLQPGWEEVADFALEWAVRNARTPNVRPLKAA